MHAMHARSVRAVLAQRLHQPLVFGVREFAAKPNLVRKSEVIKDVPPSLLETMEIVLADQDMKALKVSSEALLKRLESRRDPVEDSVIQKKANQVQMRMFGDLSHLSDLEAERCEPMIKKAITPTLRSYFKRWEPSNYDSFQSYSYLLARFSMEYSIMLKIFKELRHLDEYCAPRDCLDFGSGVGSVYWTMRRQFPNSFRDYMGVEPCRAMADIARLMVLGGDPDRALPLGFYANRRKLPASEKTAFDMVVSAFSLLELPSRRERLDVLKILWGKTRQHLVIVEDGTHAGFRLVKEARDFVYGFDSRKDCGPVYTIAPCTHDLPCKRLDNISYNYPCTFPAKYTPLLGDGSSSVALYSYVILSKTEPKRMENAARLIEGVIRKPRRSICRMCTSKGELSEKTFTKKMTPEAYANTRYLKWGDICLEENTPSCSKGSVFRPVGAAPDRDDQEEIADREEIVDDSERR